MPQLDQEDGFTQVLGRVVHNPWSALTAWLALIGLLLAGVGTFTDLDKRVETNAIRVDAHERELTRVRQAARIEREEMRQSFNQINTKLDEINRYLRSSED